MICLSCKCEKEEQEIYVVYSDDYCCCHDCSELWKGLRHRKERLELAAMLDRVWKRVDARDNQPKE